MQSLPANGKIQQNNKECGCKAAHWVIMSRPSPRRSGSPSRNISESNELIEFLQERGFTEGDLQTVVKKYHELVDNLQHSEWVNREEFKKFFDIREDNFADKLFDTFKNTHSHHTHGSRQLCPDSGGILEGTNTEEPDDSINLKEFLCSVILLQSNDTDSKLRVVYDLYNHSTDAEEITRDDMEQMMRISMEENKISLTNEQLDRIVDNIFAKMDTNNSNTICFQEFKTAFNEFPKELQMMTIGKGMSTTTCKDFLHAREDEDGIGTSHPDFVIDNYDSDDEEEPEGDDDSVYFPERQHTVRSEKAKKPRRFKKIRRNGPKIAMLVVYSLINVGFFLWSFLDYGLSDSPDYTGLLGWGVPFSRGFAQMLKFNTVLTLLTVSRNLLTYVRATKLFRVIPLDKNIQFHKLIAFVIAGATIGHWASHYVNFHNISGSSLQELQAVNPVYYTSVPSFATLALATWPGLTGHIMVIILIFMFLTATNKTRREKFERFYYTHHLFILFYACLLVHGISKILGNYEYWKWFVGPAAIYATERIVRIVRQQRTIVVSRVLFLPDRTLTIEMVPPASFKYKPGQYIFLNCPSISQAEWHPFTLTSTPEERVISVHIRAAGNWTRKLHAMCEELGKSDKGKRRIIHSEKSEERLHETREEVEKRDKAQISHEQGGARGNGETREQQGSEQDREQTNQPTGEQQQQQQQQQPENEGSAVDNEQRGEERPAEESGGRDTPRQKSKRNVNFEEPREVFPTNLRLRIDGPYGSATEHVFSYEHAILIGAGIGVTPFASVLKHILNKLEGDRKHHIRLKKVHFYWTCREQGAFQWFADTLTQLEMHDDAENFLEVNTFLTGAHARHDVRSILLWYGLQEEFARNRVDLVTGLSSRTYWGRPNYDHIIKYLFQQYRGEKIGVFYCGPKALASDLHEFCKIHAKETGSHFHFHKENF